MNFIKKIFSKNKRQREQAQKQMAREQGAQKALDNAVAVLDTEFERIFIKNMNDEQKQENALESLMTIGRNLNIQSIDLILEEIKKLYQIAQELDSNKSILEDYKSCPSNEGQGLIHHTYAVTHHISMLRQAQEELEKFASAKKQVEQFPKLIYCDGVVANDDGSQLRLKNSDNETKTFHYTDFKAISTKILNFIQIGDIVSLCQEQESHYVRYNQIIGLTANRSIYDQGHTQNRTIKIGSHYDGGYNNYIEAVQKFMPMELQYKLEYAGQYNLEKLVNHFSETNGDLAPQLATIEAKKLCENANAGTINISNSEKFTREILAITKYMAQIKTK